MSTEAHRQIMIAVNATSSLEQEELDMQIDSFTESIEALVTKNAPRIPDTDLKCSFECDVY